MSLALLLACAQAPEPVQSEPSGSLGVTYDGMDWSIGRGWAVVAPTALQPLAERMVSSTLLLGCEDNFPRLPVAETWDGPAVELRVDAVGDSPQDYRIAYTGDPARVVLTGASEQALQYAALAFIESLEFERDCSWPFRGPSQAPWTPVEVEDGPDVLVRMGFASFKGDANSNFLPNLVHAGLGRCEDPLDTEPFWEATLDCDPARDERCAQVHRRLDALVLGRFTHALDEGHPFQVSAAITDETGCDGATLYTDVVDYLADRHVQLIPTAFGLESRTPNTPLGGSRVPEELPAETWGFDGDVSLSEGLLAQRDLTVCETSEGLFLSPSCEALSSDGRVTGALELAAVDGDTTLPGERSVNCEPLAICEVKSPCWLPTETDRGVALTPATAEVCSNPALRVLLPTDTMPDRLLALTFLAQVPQPRDLVVKVIARGPDGVTPAQDVYMWETTDEEYLDLDDGWERFSVIFRVPSDEDEDWTQAFVQLLGAPGSGLLIDDLVVEEVDGRLAAVDPDSIDDPCLTVDPGWEPPLRPMAYRSVDGPMAQPLASVRVDPACASPGDVWPLSYRTLVPAGLWPNLLVRQKAWTWTPDTLNPRFWEHPFSPHQQLIGEGDYTLVSDLGGEVRGLGRDGTPVDHRLADFMCRVVQADCPDDALCDCSDETADLLLGGDMYTPLHNGARGHTQVPFGGFVGDTWTARRRLPSGTTFLSWWHYDALRVGAPVSSMDQMWGMVADFASDGFNAIGASAWDPDNQRVWAAMAAGGLTAGTAHYGWGSDEQAFAVMLQAGRTAWAPGVRMEQPSLPEVAGMTRESNTLSWPLEDDWWRITDSPATLRVTADGDWARFYAELPETCQVDGVAHNARWEALGVPFSGTLELTFADCVGGVVDAVYTFTTTPRVNYPPRADEGLLEWTSDDGGDPRAKVCGDGETWDCVGASWPEPL